jgi:hypothetical protein
LNTDAIKGAIIFIGWTAKLRKVKHGYPARQFHVFELLVCLWLDSQINKDSKWLSNKPINQSFVCELFVCLWLDSHINKN